MDLWGRIVRGMKEKKDIKYLLRAVGGKDKAESPSPRNQDIDRRAGDVRPVNQEAEILLGRIGDARAIIVQHIRGRGEGEDT
jgi:hypothetical protein